MSKKRVRIGIVGAGDIVKTRHLPALKAMPEVEIVAVSNASVESSRRFCEEFAPEAEPMQYWPELVSRDDLDAIWIGTPPILHSEVSCYALRTGKHVFCQARMARSLSEAQLMWEAGISSHSRVSMLCPAPHGMRGDVTIRRLLAEGAIGQPHQVTLHSLSESWLNPEAPAHWRQRVDMSGLQVLTFGIYVEVLQRWLGDIVAVQADGSVVFRERQGYEVEVPDFLHVLCTFRSGAKGSLNFSGVAAHGPQDTLAIYGDKGTLTYNFITDEIRLGPVGGSMEAVTIPPEEIKEWTVERDFINAVLNPEVPRPKPDFLEGLKYMRVVQAAAESMDGGDMVRVA